MSRWDSPIAKLGHVAAHTPDLDESIWFFQDVLGLKLTSREDGIAYFRGLRDWEHHTLSLIESGRTGVDHIAFRTKSSDELDALTNQLESDGEDVIHVETDEEAGQGEAIRVEKFGHPYEFYYDMAKPDAPSKERSRLQNRVYSEAIGNRISPRRIDHVHVQDSISKEHAAWLQDVLKFQVNEQYRMNDGDIWGWWLSVTPLPHDIAIHRRKAGDPPMFDHLAFHLDSLQDLWAAADVLAEHNLKPDGGPGKHAITSANFLYVSDPASNLCIEFFAGPGYLNFEPDWEPIEWTEDEIGGETSHQWIGEGPGWEGLEYPETYTD